MDMMEQIVFIFKRGEIDLPSHPKLSQKFMELIETGASLQKIAEVLKRDVAISSKLISISNSPFYRGMAKYRTLEQAIGRLGLNTTKQYVDAILHRALYTTKNKNFTEIIRE